MSYNLTNLTSGTTISDLVLFSNEVTGGIFSQLFIIAVFVILMVATKEQGFDKGLLASSWTCFLLSSILVYGKFLNLIFPLGFLVVASFTTLYIYMNREI